MGRRQFWRWVEQCNREKEAEAGHSTPHTWANTENSPAWAEMRAKRERARGR